MPNRFRPVLGVLVLLSFACADRPKAAPEDLVVEVDMSNDQHETIDAEPGPMSMVPPESEQTNPDVVVTPPEEETPVDPPPPAALRLPGSACSCDADCANTADNRGLCVQGICMTIATSACSAGGSQEECAVGSRCWGIQGVQESLCWPDCDAFDCDGFCDSDGSCVFTAETLCDASCSALCVEPASTTCSAAEPNGTCDAPNELCVEGECRPACSAAQTNGHCASGSSCVAGACQMIATGCPDWRCTGSTCTDLILLPGSSNPNSTMARNAGYYLASPARYSWIRRDIAMLIQYAACEVAVRFPNTAPLGISDLAQMDGLTPGVDNNSPRHPLSTHRGNDFDVAYYQTDGDNDPHIVCGDGSDTNWNGRPGTYNDGYFCTTNDNIVDWERQLWWWVKLAETPLVRVFGIDQTFVNSFVDGIMDLEMRGEVTPAVAQRALMIGYGANGGWQFHHHHSHHSFRAPQ
jgi:hypothetical protein